MKRLFTLMTAMCLFTSALFAQVIYTTNFRTEDEFNTWTVIDSNEDATTWTYDEWGDPFPVFYSYSGANAANDWLISPAITPTETGTVILSFDVKGSSYTEKLEVFIGSEGTVDAMTNRLGEELSLNNDLVRKIYLLDVVANETFHLGFRACSDADKWRIYLSNINVEFTTNPVDLCASEITAPVSDFDLGEETVTVKIKNIGMADVNSFDVVLSCDSTVVAIETVNQALAIGEEMEYTFNTKIDLSTPRTTYLLTVYTSHTDDINTANNACSTVVLHKAPASVPYFMGFETSEYTEEIKIFNLNDDDGDWEIYTDPWYNLARTGNMCLAYNYNKYNNADDWAILEPISITEPGYYVLKFWYSGDDSHPESLGVYYGNDAHPSSMTNKVVEYVRFARSSYEESINIIYIEEPQDIYIGFYAFSDKDENWLCVDDVTFDKISSESVDLVVGKITNPLEYVHIGTSPTIEFSINNYGILDAAATVNVKIDEETVFTQELDIKAQEQRDFAVDGILNTLIAGVYEMTIEVLCDNDNELSNNTDTVTLNVMGEASLRWDFEDGMVPEEMTFLVEDDGTVNPSAGHEFNEAGWGIFNIQEHALYGEHVLAATSWLDGTEKADRWCILPPVNLGKEAYLVWDAASFNPYYLESYSIMISTNGLDTWYFFTLDEFLSESADFKTRGVSLNNYADTDSVYIAFRLRSKNCEHLILDNISLYGAVSSKVEKVDAVTPGVVTLNDEIVVNSAEVAELALYDMGGRLVATSSDNRLSTKAISNGIYIVKVTTTDNVYTQRVSIR